MTPQEVVDAVTEAAEIFVQVDDGTATIRVPSKMLILIREEQQDGVAYLTGESELPFAEEVRGWVPLHTLECSRILNEVNRRANA